jgi:cation diffusion facilitator CzcD-associated flavoprotein CzcO
VAAAAYDQAGKAWRVTVRPRDAAAAHTVIAQGYEGFELSA